MAQDVTNMLQNLLNRHFGVPLRSRQDLRRDAVVLVDVRVFREGSHQVGHGSDFRVFYATVSTFPLSQQQQQGKAYGPFRNEEAEIEKSQALTDQLETARKHADTFDDQPRRCSAPR